MRKLFDLRAISGLVYIVVASAGGLVVATSAMSQLDSLDSGIFFYLQSIMPIALLFDMGLLVVGSREMAFAYGRGQRSFRPSDMTDEGSVPGNVQVSFSKLRFFFVSILLIITGGVGVIELVFDKFLDIEQSLSLTVVGASASITLLSYKYQSILESSGRFHVERFAATFGSLCSTIGVLIGCYAYGGLLEVVAGWLCGPLSSLFLKHHLCRKYEGAVLNASDVAYSLVETYKKAFSVFVLQFGGVATKYFQYPIIVSFVGVVELGPYFFVVRIAGALDSAISVFFASKRAVLSQHIGAKRYGEALELMNNSIRFVVFGCGVSVFFLGYVLPLVLDVLDTGKDFSSVPFWAIALDLFVLCVSGTLSQFVIASGKNPFASMVLLSGGLTVSLLFILVPLYGVAGAAWSQVLATLMTNFWFSIYWYRVIRAEFVRLVHEE